MAAQHRQPRLFLGADDIERDPGFAAHPFDEFMAVAGPAASLGRDAARKANIPALQLVGADRQRAERALHRRIGQAPAGRQSLAQLHHAAEGIDHGEVSPRRARDQQAAIVGAKIERGIGLAIGRALEGGDVGKVGLRAGDRGLVGHARTAPRVAACTFGARLPPAGIARIGLGRAFVAEIGYLTGLAAPFFPSILVSVRRECFRHDRITFISPHANPWCVRHLGPSYSKHSARASITGKASA